MVADRGAVARDAAMKKIIIMIALVAVLAGGGFYAWTTFSANEGQEETDVASDHSGEGTDDTLLFVDLDSLTAPFIRDGRFAQYVVISITLEVADDSAKSTVRRNIPRLRDAFVSELHALAAIRSPQQKLINLARVKARMMAGAERVLGQGIVIDVLVQLAS